MPTRRALSLSQHRQQKSIVTVMKAKPILTDECDMCVGGETGKAPCDPNPPAEDAGSSDGNTDGTATDAGSDGNTDGTATDAGSSDGNTDGTATDAAAATGIRMALPRMQAAMMGTPMAPPRMQQVQHGNTEGLPRMQAKEEHHGSAADAGHTNITVNGCTDEDASNYNALAT